MPHNETGIDTSTDLLGLSQEEIEELAGPGPSLSRGQAAAVGILITPAGFINRRRRRRRQRRIERLMEEQQAQIETQQEALREGQLVQTGALVNRLSLIEALSVAL